MQRIVMCGTIVALSFAFTPTAWAQNAPEVERLRKENELLKKENDLLKKEVVLLKKEIELAARRASPPGRGFAAARLAIEHARPV